MSIFKVCDIRGVYGDDLTDDTALRLGLVIGHHVTGKMVVVGGDLRPSTHPLRQALVRGLTYGGARIVDLGTVPTPVFYMAKRQLSAAAGIMITASHNPARYNGFKLMLGDRPISAQGIRDLAKSMAEIGEIPHSEVEAKPEPAQWDACGSYRTYVTQTYAGLQPHKIVIDAGNGAMWSLAPSLLSELGQTVHCLYCTPDGTFPNRDPNPAVPEHLETCRSAVLGNCADLGVAYDGDGDRVIFIDNHGRVLPADKTMVLFVRHLLRKHPGAGVVYDQKCSAVVPEAIRAAGGHALIEKSGHAFIKQRLLDENAVLGGEVSGHYFFAELGGDDALYATLMLIRILDELKVSLSEAIDTVPAYAITPDLRVPCSPQLANQILQELEVGLDAFPQSHMDGVRIEFPKGWALARISVTEPLLTMRMEAQTKKDLNEIVELVRSASPQLRTLLELTN